MNLIEIILHILNRGFSFEEARHWLESITDSASIQLAILECLNQDGKFVHSDDDRTPVFPLRYQFTADGNLENGPISEATIESMVDAGIPIDPDTGDDLLWTGQVVDLIPIPEDGEDE